MSHLEVLEARTLLSAADLDRTFSLDGKARITILNNLYSQAGAVAIQADGKIVIGCRTAVTKDETIQAAVARFNTDGTLDTTFGANGINGIEVDAEANGDLRHLGLLIKPDGKILFAVDQAVVQFNTEGIQDPSFDDDGIAESLFSLVAMTRDSSGKILVVGDNSAQRLNADGSSDTSFGTLGTVTLGDASGDNEFHATDVDLQSDGKIVVTGYTGVPGFDTIPTLVRLTTSGAFDTTFGGGDGVAPFETGLTTEFANSAVILSNGKILVTDYEENGFGALLRFNSNGTPDTSLDVDGMLTFDFVNDIVGTSPEAIMLAPDGKILVAGTGKGGGFAVARFNSNLTLDTTFSNDGRIFAGAGTGHAAALVLDADGKLVVAGTTTYEDKKHRLHGEPTVYRFKTSATAPLATVTNNKLITSGTTGDDTINVNINRSNHVTVECGDDFMEFEESAVTTVSINGGAGNDSILVNVSIDASTLIGGKGNDTLSGPAGSTDEIIGGRGSDTASFATHSGETRISADGVSNDGEDGEFDNVSLDTENITGGDGNDRIYGTAGPNVLIGGSGRDTIFAAGGDDLLIGDFDNDKLFGEAGDDTLTGNSGRDFLDGGSGNDLLFGGAAIDTMIGNAGNDIFLALDNVTENLSGGSGDDSARRDVSDILSSIERTIV